MRIEGETLLAGGLYDPLDADLVRASQRATRRTPRESLTGHPEVTEQTPERPSHP